jgi:aryl-phospho-beta-D-glucosidase BglC (GH1 family)
MAQTREAEVQTAFARAQHLRHGINASEWFAQAQDYSAIRTDKYTDAADIALMAKLGFDHVRISIDADALEHWPTNAEGLNADFVARLDKAVDAVLANGMAVEIDVHPDAAFKDALRTSDSGVDRLVMLWMKLARHYAGYDPEHVFFEILNEPEVRDAYRWEGIQQRVADAIRAAAPKQTILAAGDNWSDIWDLAALHPLVDGNVIYNFHFYEPHEFTHQGAAWGEWWWRYTHGVQYPSDESQTGAILAETPDAVSRYKMKRYFMDHWDAHRMKMLMDEAAAWGKANHVPVTCNEFGALRDHMDAQSRMNWIRDMRTAMEEDGIGWTMWDYRGGFGVVRKQDGQPAKVDEQVVEALGLNGRD